MSVPCFECKAGIPTQVVYLTTMEEVFQKCCDYFNVTHHWIKGRHRRRDKVLARQMAMYMCRIFTPSSLQEIGYFFDGRDHTTVIHAIKTINDLCDTDERIEQRFKKLKFYVRN